MAGLLPSNKKNFDLLDLDFDDFSNAFEEFFTEKWPLGKKLEKSSFKLDVQENDKEYLLEAELPGVKKEELNVTLNDGILTISVEREKKLDEEKKNYIHKERHYSSMRRSIRLPKAKTDGVKAKLEEGVLNISVAKEEQPDTSVKINIE